MSSPLDRPEPEKRIMAKLEYPLENGTTVHVEGTPEEIVSIIHGLREEKPKKKRGRPPKKDGHEVFRSQTGQWTAPTFEPVGWTAKMLKDFENCMPGASRIAWEMIKANGRKWTKTEDIAAETGFEGRALGGVFGGFRNAMKTAHIRLPVPYEMKRKKMPDGTVANRYRLTLEAAHVLGIPYAQNLSDLAEEERSFN